MFYRTAPTDKSCRSGNTTYSYREVLTYHVTCFRYYHKIRAVTKYANQKKIPCQLIPRKKGIKLCCYRASYVRLHSVVTALGIYTGCPTRYHIQCVPLATIYSVSHSLPYTECPTRYHIQCVPLATIYSVSHSLPYTECPTHYHIQCDPLATEPGITLIILTPMKTLQRNLTRSTFVV